MLVSYCASPAPCLALFPRERYLQRVLRREAVGCVWRMAGLAGGPLPTRLLVSSCYPARSLGWIVRALSSSLRYDANRDNQRKLTANVGSDRNSQSIPEAELADAHASQRRQTTLVPPTPGSPRLLGLPTARSLQYGTENWNCDHQPVYHHHVP